MVFRFAVSILASAAFCILAQDSTSTSTDTSVILDKLEVTAKKVQSKEGAASTGYRHSKAQIGPLGEADIKDIPFTINVTSGEQVENRGAHILADALRTNPTAVEIQLPQTDGRGQSEMNLRGFDPFYLQDGLLMRNTLPVPVEDVERIEVQNGLSGFFYGFGAPGGTMNFVTKQPLSAPAASVSLGQYNGGINFVHADVGGPVTSDNKLTSRFTAYTEDGRSFIDQASQRRSRLAAALGYRLLENTTLKLNLSHQDLLLQGQQAPFLINLAKNINVPDANRFDPTRLYGRPWVYVKGKQDMAGASVESKLSAVFTLRGAYNYSGIWRKNNGVSDSLIDNNGNYRARYSDGSPSNTFEHSAYALADANLKTWQITHKVTAGWTYDGTIQTSNPKAVRNILVNRDSINIANPTYYDSMPNVFVAAGKPLRANSVYNSVLIGDRLTYGMYSLLAGANYTQYRYRNENIDTGLIKTFTQTKLSPSVALTVKPRPEISVYASYMQGIAAGGYNASAVNGTEILPPSVNTQYEVGVKATVFKVDLSSALFRINKINEYTDPADNVYKQDGREIHQGFELSASGKLWNCLTLGGGGTLMDAHVEKTPDAALKDKTPANVPEKQAKAFVEYDVPGMPGLCLNAGGGYTGLRWVDAKNTASIPPVQLYDAGARYRVPAGSHAVTLNLRVSNLLNTTYWAAYKPAGTVGLCLGAPRLVSLSMKYEL